MPNAERQWIEALVDESAIGSEPLQFFTQQAGFSIYRNTVFKGCIDALVANYPTVFKTVGQDWFFSAAYLYVQQNLPTDPCLLHYGKNWPEFLEALPALDTLPCVPVMARVDQLWLQALTAADAVALDAPTLNAYMQENGHETSTMVLHCHPAARWMQHDRWPLHTLWKHTQNTSNIASATQWQGEALLFTRPDAAVQCHLFSAAGCAFLDICYQSGSVEQAVAMALACEPDLNVSLLVAQLLQTGALCLPTHHKNCTDKPVGQLHV